MNKPVQLLVFTLDRRRYAFRLQGVQRVVRAVAVTPLPDAPEIVLGIINVQGQIVPVINMRRCFRLPEKKIGSSDQFIIVATARQIFALVADAVLGVVDCPAGVVAAEEILPHMERVEGVLILADGMLLISDIETILSLTGAALNKQWEQGNEPQSDGDGDGRQEHNSEPQTGVSP